MYDNPTATCPACHNINYTEGKQLPPQGTVVFYYKCLVCKLQYRVETDPNALEIAQELITIKTGGKNEIHNQYKDKQC